MKKAEVLSSMGSQRVRHDLATKQDSLYLTRVETVSVFIIIVTPEPTIVRVIGTISLSFDEQINELAIYNFYFPQEKALHNRDSGNNHQVGEKTL